MTTAVITGITGQDGSYLAELLLEKGYQVIGLVRRRSETTAKRIQHLLSNNNLSLTSGDITDCGSLHRLVNTWKPDEFYNLAAMSFVGRSWKEPALTGDVTGLGVTNCLEAIRNIKPDTKFVQASSSEMFGKVRETPQNENTPFHPRSPYGVAKVYGYWITRNYRESYGMYCSNAIMFNHESPRRGIEFVTRKITNGAAKIKLGMANKLELGNLDAKRDWGHAADYMQACWLIAQHTVPDDFVISTGNTHSIEELLTIAFNYVNLDWNDFVVQNPKYIRPADVSCLQGDSSKARQILAWKPNHTFKGLIEEMVEADLQSLKL